MLAIRLQRVGRKGYAVYRVAVQEAQRHPSSGRVVAYVGNYNPHTKAVSINKEKVELYLKNGAQPSPRVTKLLIAQKITLPDWVTKQGKKDKKLRNPDKLRKNQPAKPAPAPTTEEVIEETPEAAPEAEALVEVSKEEANEKPANDVKEPAEAESDSQPEAGTETETSEPETKS